MMKMREIFFNNKPLEGKKLSDFESEQFGYKKDKVVENTDFRKILESIDKQTVWAIVEEVARKSGIDPKDLNKEAFENVFNLDGIVGGGSSEKIIGSFNVGSNKIFLDFKKIKEIAENFGVDSEKVTLESLFHELMHSVSKGNLHIFQSSDMQRMEFNDKYVFAGAYRSSKDSYTTNLSGKITKSESSSMFDMLDEGIVEKLSGEVFEEYMRRTGTVSEDELADYREKFSRNEGRHYPRLVQGVERMCQLIADRAGVDSIIVWRSLVRGLFHFGTISKNKEVEDWFLQLFGEDFLQKLGAAKNADEFLEVLNSIKV